MVQRYLLMHRQTMLFYHVFSIINLLVACIYSAPTAQNSSLEVTSYSIACPPLPQYYEPGDPNSCLSILNGIPETSIIFTKGPARRHESQVPWLLSSQAFRNGNLQSLDTNLTEQIATAPTATRNSSIVFETVIDECLLSARFADGVPLNYKERWPAAAFFGLARQGWRDCMQDQNGRMVKIDVIGSELRIELKAFKQRDPWPTEIRTVPVATGVS